MKWRGANAAGQYVGDRATFFDLLRLLMNHRNAYSRLWPSAHLSLRIHARIVATRDKALHGAILVGGSAKRVVVRTVNDLIRQRLMALGQDAIVRCLVRPICVYTSRCLVVLSQVRASFLFGDGTLKDVRRHPFLSNHRL